MDVFHVKVLHQDVCGFWVTAEDAIHVEGRMPRGTLNHDAEVVED